MPSGRHDRSASAASSSDIPTVSIVVPSLRRSLTILGSASALESTTQMRSHNGRADSATFMADTVFSPWTTASAGRPSPSGCSRCHGHSWARTSTGPRGRVRAVVVEEGEHDPVEAPSDTGRMGDVSGRGGDGEGLAEVVLMEVRRGDGHGGRCRVEGRDELELELLVALAPGQDAAAPPEERVVGGHHVDAEAEIDEGARGFARSTGRGSPRHRWRCRRRRTRPSGTTASG